MPLEVWIVLGFAIAGVILGAVARLRRRRAAAPKAERNVYPLW